MKSRLIEKWFNPLRCRLFHTVKYTPKGTAVWCEDCHRFLTKGL